jgi:hypothetical protein
MEKKYWIRINNENKGPYTISELISKNVQLDSYVWEKSFENWKKASEITEIRDLLTYNNHHKKTEGYNNSSFNQFEKNKVTIDAYVIKIILTSILLSFVIILITNHFSKQWYFLIDRNDYRYESWLSSKGDDNYVKYDKAMKISIISYDINSVFGSKIEKINKTGYVWGDINTDSWVKGNFNRGKFNNYFTNLYFYFLLTMKDWIYFMMLSFIIIGIRIFNKNNKIVIS